jgi:hypothetical protein
MSDEADRRMQELLSQLRAVVDVMSDLAVENGIEHVEFLGSRIHFGVRQGYAYEIREAGGTDKRPYLPAARGPIIDESHWNHSSFRCWPEEKQLDWLYGDGPRPKTAYQEDDEEDFRG